MIEHEQVGPLEELGKLGNWEIGKLKEKTIEQDKELSQTGKLVYGALIAIIVLALILPARWFLADSAINNVRRNLESWDLSGTVPSLAIWNSTLAELETALKYNSKQADYYSIMGLLYEWRGFLVEDIVLTVDQQNQFRQTSIDAYRQATVLRPAWPDDWANLARQKALLRQLDNELLMAMDKALTLGPAEARVHLLMTDVTTLVWPLPPVETELKEKALHAIELGLSSNIGWNNHLEFLSDRNLLANICPLLNADLLVERAQQACQQASPFSFISSP